MATDMKRCKKGHALTEENTLANGRCRLCMMEGVVACHAQGEILPDDGPKMIVSVRRLDPHRKAYTCDDDLEYTAAGLSLLFNRSSNWFYERFNFCGLNNPHIFLATADFVAYRLQQQPAGAGDGSLAGLSNRPRQENLRKLPAPGTYERRWHEAAGR